MFLKLPLTPTLSARALLAEGPVGAERVRGFTAVAVHQAWASRTQRVVTWIATMIIVP
jgi:hypothetical protein